MYYDGFCKMNLRTDMNQHQDQLNHKYKKKRKRNEEDTSNDESDDESDDDDAEQDIQSINISCSCNQSFTLHVKDFDTTTSSTTTSSSSSSSTISSETTSNAIHQIIEHFKTCTHSNSNSNSNPISNLIQSFNNESIDEWDVSNTDGPYYCKTPITCNTTKDVLQLLKHQSHLVKKERISSMSSMSNNNFLQNDRHHERKWSKFTDQ